MRRRAFIKLVCASLFSAILVGGVNGRDQYITLASTTSTEASGLFEHLLPSFEKKTGIEVRVVAVGSGEALELGQNGDADALLVHDPEAEQDYVRAGYGVDRRDVMYNDFIIVGPKSDPAGIRGMEDAVAAYKKIAASESPFASRGDDSGTHAKELQLWEDAGIAQGEWYRELGTGMGETLNTAAGMDAYTMTDRGTWANFSNRQNLVVLVEGDPRLCNPYSSILVSPRRHPHVKIGLARQWHEWLTSEEGQQAIADYEIGGQQLFFPTYQRGSSR
jgi:tungstate transport system substrate-binding protein